MLALLAVLVLAGCHVRSEVVVDVAEDGSGRVEVRVAADEDVVEARPGLADELRLDDLRLAGWEVEGPQPADGGGLELRVAKPFARPEDAGAAIEELFGDAGPLRRLELRVERSWLERRWRVAAEAGLDDLEAFADEELVALVDGVPFEEALEASGRRLQDVVAMELRVRLPDAVEDLRGGGERVAPRELLWAPALEPGTTVRLEAEADRRDDDALRWLIVAAVAGGLLLLLLLGRLVRWWWRRRKARRARLDPVPTRPAEEASPTM